jgi:hypothetical protein
MRPNTYPLAPAILSPEQKAAYYQMRADLMHDYAFTDTLDRMLVDQAALSWCRLQSSQANYFRLLDYHTHSQSVQNKCGPDESEKALTLTFTTDESHRGFKLALQDLRESENSWYKAARQLERARTDREKREHRKLPKAAPVRVPMNDNLQAVAHPATLEARPDASHPSAVLEPSTHAAEINCGSSVLPDSNLSPRSIAQGFRKEGHGIRPSQRLPFHRDRAA